MKFDDSDLNSARDWVGKYFGERDFTVGNVKEKLNNWRMDAVIQHWLEQRAPWWNDSADVGIDLRWWLSLAFNAYNDSAVGSG